MNMQALTNMFDQHNNAQIQANRVNQTFQDKLQRKGLQNRDNGGGIGMIAPIATAAQFGSQLPTRPNRRPPTPGPRRVGLISGGGLLR